MDEKQTKMWDTLAELDGEEVLRVLTDWHGLQLLDDGFYGHMVDEGYIDEYSNCENGAYECDSCPLNVWCDRRQYMEAARDADTFEDFCCKFLSCKGCPLAELKGDCEEELWPKWKEEHGYGW